MILTSDEIIKEVRQGNITLSPFSADQVNPNSYNYRLGDHLKVYLGSSNGEHFWIDTIIPDEGYILEPGRMYLGHTQEKIGSSKYAMSLIGRSSIGRLGLFVQVSANLGHTTSCHCWTLELVSSIPTRVYPGMIIGQVSFWANRGELHQCNSQYIKYDNPVGRILAT